MTKLTDALVALYSYTEADTAKLARRLNERMRATWINTLSGLAKQHGCSQLGVTPKGADARLFRDTSNRDAESIARTFNRELAAQVKRLQAANPKGNRSYYSSNLSKWRRQRDSHKLLTIGLQTDSFARQHAFSRFYQMNPNIARGFVAAGPPAVCKICMRIFAAGIVDFAYTQVNVFPAHVRSHSWRVVTPTRVDCARLWVG